MLLLLLLLLLHDMHSSCAGLPPKDNLLLLKVPTIFLVDEDEVEVVPHRELRFNATHRRRQRERRHKEAHLC